MPENLPRPMRNDIEGIDSDKLLITIRKNALWILLIFIVINLSAYLTIRYTKDLYESESELKLDLKKDATELGIKSVVEDQNLNHIAGEIELIRSKIFFSRIIDSLDLDISYYAIGKVLDDEMYKRSPFSVTYSLRSKSYYDVPFYFSFKGDNSYTLKIGESKESFEGKLGVPLVLKEAELVITKTDYFSLGYENKFFFTINSRASLLDYLSKNIAVEPLNFNANTIRISFRDHNAQKAFDIVNKIDSIYLGYSYEQKNLTNKQKIDWLNNELDQVERKMESYENYFEAFTLQNKSNDLNVDLKKTVLLINKIDSQRFELNKRLSELNSLMDDLSAGNYALSFSHQQFLPDYINPKLELLQRMLQEQDKLGLAYNENTFAFRQKDKELTALKNSLFSQLTELKKNWLKAATELGIKKDKLEREFATMPDKNTQFSKNQRFYKLHEELYLTMMQSKAQFEIAQAGSTPDFKILSPATIPSSPISPKKYMILGIGFVAGIVLNFFFIGILYLLNDRINSVQEIEKSIDAPMLGVIPTSYHTKKSPFHVIDNPKSMVSESMRTLRSNLDFFFATNEHKVIAVSSTISGEGKSFLALNLGGVLAMSKKRVALLDLDMRKSKSNLPFEIADEGKGISTILIKKHDWKDCLIKTSIGNFDYIPSGPHPPNPSELLLNGEFSTLLDNLKREYDFIVLDTPPIGLVTDGIMAMKRADLSIYVFRANYSKMDFIRSFQRMVTINKFKNIAIVLNSLPTNSRTYGYGYYEDKTPKKSFFTKLART